MKRKILPGVTILIALGLAVAGVLQSQEPPEPPEPPSPALAPEPLEPPEPAEPPEPPQDFFAENQSRLGVELREVTADKARELKLPGEYGAIVEEVEPKSPAAKAGMMKGDVVLEFAGERVRSVAQLRRLVRETPAGRTVNVQVSRGGEIRNLSVKMESAKNLFNFSYVQPKIAIPKIEIPKFNFNFEGSPYIFSGGGPVLGVSGDELTSQLAAYFGVKQGKGVLVREVTAGSPAEKAGLKAGDVIVGIEGKQVGSIADLRHALPRDFEGKKRVSLSIVRDRREQKLSVELEAPSEALPFHRVEEEVYRISPEELHSLAAEVLRQQAEVGKVRASAETARNLAQSFAQEKQRALTAELLRQQAEISKSKASLEAARQLAQSAKEKQRAMEADLARQLVQAAKEKQRAMEQARQSLELLKQQLRGEQLRNLKLAREKMAPSDVI
jgi:serine protease Do